MQVGDTGRQSHSISHTCSVMKNGQSLKLSGQNMQDHSAVSLNLSPNQKSSPFSAHSDSMEEHPHFPTH